MSVDPEGLRKIPEHKVTQKLEEACNTYRMQGKDCTRFIPSLQVCMYGLCATEVVFLHNFVGHSIHSGIESSRGNVEYFSSE